MLTKAVFLLVVGLATVALCATTLSQPRLRTRSRPDDPELNTIRQTSEVPSNIIKAEMAHCQPEKKTVELDLPQEYGTVFFPTCVRVEQCGGCCGHPLLTCRPSSTKTVTYEVTKMTAEHISSPYYVNVTKHVKCECQCSVTEQDCTTSQTYDENNCECICENEEQKRACDKRKDKLWDKDSCTCKCRKDDVVCETGEFFCQDSCKCKKEK
ncbi:vascular endothelial growth factor A-like [Scylla paramamosain]|uniref:vascular endothelial growth factor A-like n=1 Tax=Scylla paramamosain TaxID=85552 RepID=UPI00308375E8